MREPVIIARWPHSQQEEVVVCEYTLKRMPCLSIGIWARENDGRSRPTENAVLLPINHLPSLLKAINKAAKIVEAVNVG